MKFDFQHSVETLFELLTDIDYLAERSIACGELEAKCDSEQDEHCLHINMQRQVERDLPALLSNFNPVVWLSIKELWQEDGDGWSGEYQLGIEGQPITVDANFSLQPTESGCQYEIEHHCKVKIPLIGGRIEKYILNETEQGCLQELHYAAQYLAE